MAAEKAAIVTGASSGIGLAIAKVLGEEGYALTVASRRPEKLEGAVAELRDAGHEVESLAANVADEEQIKQVVAEHRERYGRLDVLVNNAGVGVGAPVGEIQTKHIDMQLAINLRQIFIFYRECVPMLREAGAEHKNALVVNTSSISGKHGEAWLSVYSATKHGVVGMDRSDEQGTRLRRHQVDRAVPRLRRHADDRLRQGAGARGGDDPPGGHRRVRALPAARVPRVRGPRDHVRAARARASSVAS